MSSSRLRRRRRDPTGSTRSRSSSWPSAAPSSSTRLAVDLVGRVLARIEEDAAAPRRASPWRTRLGAPRRRALVAAVAALLVVALVPPVRAAVLDLFRIGGVTVREVPSPPSGSPTSGPPPTEGVVRTLEEASRRVGFDVATPPGLGAPTTVAVTRDGRVVELTWGTGVGSTRLDVFDGSLSFGYLKGVWEAVTPTQVPGGRRSGSPIRTSSSGPTARAPR